MKKTFLTLMTVFTLLGVIACNKPKPEPEPDPDPKEQTDPDDDPTDDTPKPVKYPQKAEELQVFGGLNRLLVQWKKPTDPSVVLAKIFWNQDQNSVEVPIVDPEDPIQVYLEDMPEGTYAITVYTYDDEGNVSVPSEASGASYGDIYISTLIERSLTSAAMVVSTSANFEFSKKTADMISTEFRYTSTSGEIVIVDLPLEENSLYLTDFDNNAPFSFRSKFQPADGIDPVEKDWTESDEPLTVEVLELPKSTWKNVPLPTDTYGSLFDLGQYRIENLWNGLLLEDAGGPWASPVGIPRSIWNTIDLGYSAALDHVQLHHRWPYGYYGDEGVRHFQVYGSNNPNEDGSWDSWTLCGDFYAQKPSGYAADGSVGTVTQEDIDYWTDSNIYYFTPSEDAPGAGRDYRYYRFKWVDHFLTYGKTDAEIPADHIYVIGEITLFGRFTNMSDRDQYYHN